MSEKRTRKTDPARLRRGKTVINLAVEVNEDVALAVESACGGIPAGQFFAEAIQEVVDGKVESLCRSGKRIRLDQLDAERARIAEELGELAAASLDASFDDAADESGEADAKAGS